DQRAGDRRSCCDFEPGNLVLLEPEAVPQYRGTTGEIAGDPCGHNDVCARPVYGEWLACIVIFCRGLGLPLHDGSSTLMRAMLVDNDGVLGETPADGVGVSGVCREVRGDGRRQFDGCPCLCLHRRTTHRDAMTPQERTRK